MGNQCCGDDLNQYRWEGQHKNKRDKIEINPSNQLQLSKIKGMYDFALYKIFKSEYQELIKQYSGTDNKWTDVTFPPDQTSIGVIPNLRSTPTWKRIPDIIPNATFISGKIQPADIIQGQIGDCYLLSGIAALAQSQQRIYKIFPNIQTNPNGIYMVKMTVKGKYCEILVDDWIPVNDNGEALFVQPVHNQFWTLIIQKAWAKIHGSYGAIIAGLSNEILRSLTHAPTFYFEIYPQQERNYQQRNQKLFKMMIEAQKRNYVMCSGSRSDIDESMGIVPAHAYTVLGAFQINIGNLVRILCIRNPWGQKEWRGTASDKDYQFWNRIPAQIKKKIHFQQKKNDGKFFMLWQDFKQYFEQVDICCIEDKYCYNFEDAKCSGKNGVFFHFNIDHKDRYFIVAHQDTLRGQPQHIQKQGYARTTLILGKINNDGTVSYVKSKMSKQFPDQYIHKQLEPGQYVIYVKLQWINEVNKGQFVLSIYGPETVLIRQQSKIQHKDFLNKVFYDHSCKMTIQDGKQIIGNSPNDWIISKLLYTQGGFGYIVINLSENNKKKIALQYNQKAFNQSGFELKKPLKNTGTGKIIAEGGKYAMLLAKVSSREIPDRLTFPPEVNIYELN